MVRRRRSAAGDLTENPAAAKERSLPLSRAATTTTPIAPVFRFPAGNQSPVDRPVGKTAPDITNLLQQHKGLWKIHRPPFISFRPNVAQSRQYAFSYCSAHFHQGVNISRLNKLYPL